MQRAGLGETVNLAYTRPQCVKCIRLGKAIYIRVPKVMRQALGINQWDFLSVQIVGKQLRAVKLDLGSLAGMVAKSKRADRAKESVIA